MPDLATIDRLLAAGDDLARALSHQSVEPPKPAPCVPHRRTDGLLDCPNCLALAAWQEVANEVANEVAAALKLAKPIQDSEVHIVNDFIDRFREHFSVTQPISASAVALGLPAIGQRDRIQLVLEEMERRGILERTDRGFDGIVGEPRYREASTLV